jgi:hypothetical protein
LTGVWCRSLHLLQGLLWSCGQVGRCRVLRPCCCITHELQKACTISKVMMTRSSKVCVVWGGILLLVRALWWMLPHAGPSHAQAYVSICKGVVDMRGAEGRANCHILRRYGLGAAQWDMCWRAVQVQ